MWTFGRKITAGFMLAFLLLLGIGAVAYRSITSLTNANQLITHTYKVVEDVAEVLSLLKDAESGQRGYIITGDDTFLEPYQAGVAGVPAVIKDLRELTSDNPHQQKRIDEAEPLIAAKVAELKLTIDLRRKGSLDETTKVVRGGEGKKIMDNLRRIMSQMDREERDGSVMLHAITRLRKKKVPAKIAVMRDSTLVWPRTENSASVRPMPSPPPSLR